MKRTCLNCGESMRRKRSHLKFCCNYCAGDYISKHSNISKNTIQDNQSKRIIKIKVKLEGDWPCKEIEIPVYI